MNRYLKTYQEECLLDWGLVVHWSEEVFPNCQNHDFFEETISHHKLLGGARDISVVVQNSHGRIAGDVSLEDDVSSQVDIDLCLLGWEGSNRLGSTEVVEALVPDFVYHSLL